MQRVTEDGTLLLEGASLTLPERSRTAIVGPPGSGKTVLLRAIALLDPLSGGEIRFQGRPVTAAMVPDYRLQVAYLHQRPVLLEGTVRDNLSAPFSLRTWAGRLFDESWIVAQLRRLRKHESFLSQPAAELSGGESQIVALLRVLQGHPQVLLLDEPTASLDETSAAAIETLVQDWQQAQQDRALLLVTHNLQQAARLADRRVRVQEGRIVAGEAPQ